MPKVCDFSHQDSPCRSIRRLVVVVVVVVVLVVGQAKPLTFIKDHDVIRLEVMVRPELMDMGKAIGHIIDDFELDPFIPHERGEVIMAIEEVIQRTQGAILCHKATC